MKRFDFGNFGVLRFGYRLCSCFVVCLLVVLVVSLWFVYLLWFGLFACFRVCYLGVWFVNSVVHYDFFLFVVGCLIAVLAAECLLCC